MTIGAWLSDAKRANALVRAMPRVWLCQADLVSCAVNSLENSGELGKDLLGGFGLDERLGVLVSLRYPGADVFLECLD